MFLDCLYFFLACVGLCCVISLCAFCYLAFSPGSHMVEPYDEDWYK